MTMKTWLAAVLLGLILSAAPLFAQRGGRPSSGPSGGFRPSPVSGPSVRPSAPTRPSPVIRPPSPPRPGVTPTGLKTPPRPGVVTPPRPKTPPRPGVVTPPRPKTPPRPGVTPTGLKTPPRPGVARPDGRPRPSINPFSVKTPTGGLVKTVDYARHHGRTLKGGRIAYVGMGHKHWTRKHFVGRWRCWVVLCPSTRVWYFWCGARTCYLPVHYIDTVTPSQDAPDAEDVPEADAGDGLDDLP